MEASVRKSHRAFSDEPGFSVLMATSMSCTKFGGTFSRPRQTSPNSPPPIYPAQKNVQNFGNTQHGKMGVKSVFFFFFLTDNRFDCYVAGVNFAGKFTDCLVWILVGVRIDVAAAGAKQWRCHCVCVNIGRTEPIKLSRGDDIASSCFFFIIFCLKCKSVCVYAT